MISFSRRSGDRIRAWIWRTTSVCALLVVAAPFVVRVQAAQPVQALQESLVGPDTAAAERSVPPRGAVRIVSVYGRDSLVVGEVENFRARIAPGADQPVVYRWSLGDGRMMTGNPVAHRYARPGRYALVVTARNDTGTDADTLVVIVTPPLDPVPPVEDGVTAPPLVPPVEDGVTAPPPDPDPPVEDSVTPPASEGVEPERPTAETPMRDPVDVGLHGAPEIDWGHGGFTLIAVTRFSSGEAERTAFDYRRAGFRTGILVDENKGRSVAYRVVVGQFVTEEAAVAGRQRMLGERREGAFLVHALPGGGE